MDEGDDREQRWIRRVGCRAVSTQLGVSPQRLARRRHTGLLEAPYVPARRGRSPVYTRLRCWRTVAAIAFERDLAA